ncbi:malonyl-ACP O-methyltransferase BioC [Legionella sp. km772]|uniref:malonyl-ACP O-methyltransferase BioC n=1 Tax=Legionella sp. km772 TaxID=2498111 RepID=UPI000F8DE02D|nr:malonyl-ACP O-methyltransferase BioC [Legionella sp. km772]RUR05777.1 malonyl-[acyl-carrier protein] O-methyltransferase BioC [Legionella sp. km772]
MSVINEISKAFNQQAGNYEKAAKVQHEIGLRLLARLQYLKINPQYILDLGCGPGIFSRELAKMYPKARIVGLDLAPAMLKEAHKKQSWRCKWSLVAGDMKQLPFTTGLFDLVFANQVIHWGNPLEQVLRELNRVMNVNACFMFTTLGPDTFKELKNCWAGASSYEHVNSFADMHDVGDSLLSEYFLDPVMDMESLTAHYESVTHLVRALKNQGVRNINPARNQGLTGKRAWRLFAEHYEHLKTENAKYPLSYEVVYGHAWKGERQKTEHGVETFIPLNSIKTINHQ